MPPHSYSRILPFPVILKKTAAKINTIGMPDNNKIFIAFNNNLSDLVLTELNSNSSRGKKTKINPEKNNVGQVKAPIILIITRKIFLLSRKQ
jgi:hypothetical protein